MNKFKSGDKVYYPSKSKTIHTLQVSGQPSYPLLIDLRCEAGCLIEYQTFTFDGLVAKSNKVPDIIHATEENHALLEKLYGMEFEAPPVKPTSRDIIKAMLERGDKCVPCYVSDVFNNPFHIHEWTFICTVAYSRFLANNKESYKYATPFDPKTGQPITEMPVGVN